jgi:hypothetical protein
MRKLSAVVIGISMIASSLAWAEPLAPGKPAGVHAAQMGDKEWLVFGGIAAVGVGVAIAVSGGRSSNAQSQSVIVTTTATTG